MAIKTIFRLAAGCFLLFMIWFNFQRNFLLPLDGDLPAIVLPVPSYQTVMTDPFGMNVLIHDSVYAAPNRFFSHFFLATWFRTMPLFAQQLMEPIDSVYFTAALARTITQFFLVFLIAAFATGKIKFWEWDFLIAATICTPLFQTYGFYTWMAVLDQSVTYMCFYALSISLVMLFFLPFFNAATGRREKHFSNRSMLGLAILCIINSLSGPLNAPVTILICSAVVLHSILTTGKTKGLAFHQLKKDHEGSMRFYGLLALALVLSIYSFYIGRNNIENQWSKLPLSESYSRLLTGFWYHYTFKLAQPLLIGMVIFNLILISRMKPDAEASKVFVLLRWFTILAVIYILLLPLGGYRIYRSHIVRYDTIMPVTLGLMIFYVYTTIYILRQVRGVYKPVLYSLLVAGITAIYIDADRGIKNKNACERKAFEEIAKSRDEVVYLKVDCQVMNWGKMLVPAHSKSKSDMLRYWNIIQEPKLYYQD